MRILLIILIFIIGVMLGFTLKKEKEYPDWSYCDGMSERFSTYIKKTVSYESELFECRTKLYVIENKEIK